MTEPIARLATLQTRFADMPDHKFREVGEPIKLRCKDAPNFAFSGVLIDRYATSSKPRWTELYLYATDGGATIAARAWHSDNAGEQTFLSAAIVETVADAMDLWAWDSVAKGFARRLRWDVVRRVP